jgi:hypothetical protein
MASIALSQLLLDFKAEASISQNTAHGVAQRDAHIYLLNRVQKELYLAHEWPFLKVTRDITLIAAQRYYEFPEDMDFEGTNEVFVQNGTEWSKICYGIEPEDLSLYNSDDGFQSFPPLKWQVHPDETRQFEVWPIPSQGGTLRFRGRKSLVPMVNNADKCTLDDTLIVLFAAAETLAKQKSPDAEIKLQKAQALLTAIKRKQGSNKRGVRVMGGGQTGLGGGARSPRVGIDYIPLGYGSGT